MIKNISLIIICLSLGGCFAPSVSESRFLDASSKDSFFSNASNTASSYFVCGKTYQQNPLFGDREDDWPCTFTVNGQRYEVLDANSISKLELVPGSYTIIAGSPFAADDFLASKEPLTIDLSAGSTTIFVANNDHKVTLSGQTFRHYTSIHQNSIPAKYRSRNAVLMRPEN